MKVSGAADVHASAERVWAALADGSLLTRAVPGLDQFDVTEDGCRFTLTTAIAAVSGSYTGSARVVERPGPGVRVLRVTASGARGTISADLTIRLSPAGDGITDVSYTADADVDGAIAGIGQRMLTSVSRRLAADAIGGIDTVLASTVLASTVLADSAGATAVPAPVPDVAATEAAIEQARLGVGLRGERAPADTRPVPGLSAGLLAGAAAVVAGIVVGVVLGRRLFGGSGGSSPRGSTRQR